MLWALFRTGKCFVENNCISPKYFNHIQYPFKFNHGAPCSLSSVQNHNIDNFNSVCKFGIIEYSIKAQSIIKTRIFRTQKSLQIQRLEGSRKFWSGQLDKCLTTSLKI